MKKWKWYETGEKKKEAIFGSGDEENVERIEGGEDPINEKQKKQLNKIEKRLHYE